MNIVVDIGNTLIKTAIFDNGKIIEKKTFEDCNYKKIAKNITKLKKKYEAAENLILSTVRKPDKEFAAFLNKDFKNFVFFDAETKLPVKNYYKTPETLGKDRIAGVVAASNIFPETNILVFDAGTALTIDFINDKKEYYGGSIAPGIEMRYKALNHFTDKLPEVRKNENFEEIYGDSTENAIYSGVQNGILYEAEGHIERFSRKYPGLKVTFTGGDTFFFERRIKKQIFAEPNLVLIGLNIILNCNAK